MTWRTKALVVAIGTVLGALVVFSATKAGVMFLLTASLLVGFQFISFLAMVIWYGKMMDSAKKAIQSWRYMDAELKKATKTAQELHTALDSVLRFAESAPHYIPNSDNTMRDEMYNRFEKEEAPTVEEWELRDKK